MEEEIDDNAVIDLTDEFAPGAPVRHDLEENVIQLDDQVVDESNPLPNEEDAEVHENAENVLNADDNEAEKAENGAEDGENPLEEEDNPFGDDEDSDEEGGGVQVTIRKLEPTEKPAARQGKLDLDATAMINDKPIYDLDLAQMEDRPWRKPGADLTDYFNYGFTEETWNLYCERQKKLRSEFAGNQQAANNALLSAIKITNPLANPIMNTTSSVVKVLTDNGGRFKQPTHNIPVQSSIQNEQVIRTVISGTTQPAMDFTRPPPGMSMPPPMALQPPMSSVPQNIAEAPPGIDSTSDLPPGVETTSVSSAPPAFGGGLDLNLGLPPLGFNPNMPPPGMSMPPMGMLSTSLPPPGFSMPPPQFPQHSRAGFGPGPVTNQAPRPLMPSFGNVSDDDDERRSSRRKRSRSRSPRRDDRRDRESRRRGEREDRTSSRRHRSRSTSGDRRRRRDDRERGKRRERRDEDEDRKKRSRRDEDEDSGRRKEKSSKSRPVEEDESAGPSGTGNEDSPAE